MPFYEYECLSCKKIFTELRSSSEMQDPIDCPHCASSETQKVLSGFAVGRSRSVSSPPCGAPEGTPCAGGGSCPMAG